MTLLKCPFIFTGTILVLICVLVIVATTHDIPTASKFTRFKCIVTDKVHIGDCECFTKPINRNKTIITLTGHLIRQVDDIALRLRLLKKFNSFKPFLMDVRENFCNLMAKRSTVVYTRIIYDVIKKYTNMNHTCPYNGLIEFRSMELDSTKLKDALPAGEYRVLVTVFFNGNESPSIELQATFAIEEKFLIG